MTNEILIDKVKKLLELASSPNENEARLAFSRAQSLIAKYSLDITGGQNPETVISKVYELKIKSAGIKEHLHQIVDTISQIFSCRSFKNTLSGQIRIFGFATNLEIAEYAIDSIINQLNADLKPQLKQNRTITFSGSFWESASHELQRKFAPQVTNGQGIILYDKLQDWISKNLNLSTGVSFPGSTNSAGMNAGCEAAKRAQIRSALNSTASGKLLA